METIDPADLATLVLNHIPIDLVDVRTEAEFKRTHIPGAQSAPINRMSPAKLVRDRELSKSEPIFVVSQNRALAGMAAGMLRAAGCDQPIVVNGGMELWEAEHLPAIQSRRFHRNI